MLGKQNGGRRSVFMHCNAPAVQDYSVREGAEPLTLIQSELGEHVFRNASGYILKRTDRTFVEETTMSIDRLVV